MIKLSIITVVFNNLNYIEDTILNVIKLKNIYNNIEYVIIDGGSSDGTVDIIKRYQDEIDFFVSEQDKGIYDAMNKGVKNTNGDWLIFMNSGDLFHDDFINNLPKIFFDDKVIDEYEILYGDIITKQEQKVVTILQNKINPNFFFFDTICHQSVFFHRNVFSKIGYYNLDYKIISDRELLFRIAKFKGKFYHINQIISIWDEEGFSKENIHLFKMEEKLFITKNFRFIKRKFLILKYKFNRGLKKIGCKL